MANNPKNFKERIERLERGVSGNIQDTSRCGLNDADAAVFAQTLIAQSGQLAERMQTIWFYDNEIGDEGMESIAEMFHHYPGLVNLTLHENPFGEIGMAALEEAIIGGGHKNLCAIQGGSEALRRHCLDNEDRAQDYAKMIIQPANHSPDEWWEILERLPAIQEVGEFDRYREEVRDPFLKFIDGLPKVDPEKPLTLEALGKPSKENGLCPLDNPRTWQQFGQIVQRLNENGIQLQAHELLEQGEPSSLFAKIIDRGCVTSLFTPENWLGASQEEIKAVLNALPKKTRERIPNRHTLLAQVGRNQQSACR